MLERMDAVWFFAFQIGWERSAEGEFCAEKGKLDSTVREEETNSNVWWHTQRIELRKAC